MIFFKWWQKSFFFQKHKQNLKEWITLKNKGCTLGDMKIFLEGNSDI